MRRGLLLVLLAMLAQPAVAQVVMLPTQVLSDRVTIGGEFLPRRLDLPSVLVVPVGQARTLPADSTWDYIEVGGMLRVSRTADTTVRATTLLILPGGTLDLGTPSDPIPAGIHVTIVLRNVPIDVSRDPFQWGNGLVNFGTVHAFTPYRTPGVDLAVDAFVGDAMVTLATTPVGWQVGDEVIFPDTKAHFAPERPDVEPFTTIASISGATVRFSRPLVFAHQSVFGLDGRVGVRPKVVNLTRNVVITSENPLGAPGHTVNIGDTACWDEEGVRFDGLGRTTVEPLDSTSADQSHIGTNQIARYAWHAHHVHMACAQPRQMIDNVLVSYGPGKWGLVVHGSHDTINRDNIALGFPGAGFVTEDGYEVRNEFTGNIGINSIPPTLYAADTVRAKANIENNAPGGEGTCFWWHGVQNIFVRNEAWGCSVGFNLFDFESKPGFFPSSPGAMPDTPFETPHDSVGDFVYINNNPFILFDQNLSVGSLNMGLEYWGLKDAGSTFSMDLVPQATHFTSINDYIGVIGQPSQGFNELWLKDSTVLQNYQLGNGSAVSDIDIFYAGSCVRTTTGYVRFKVTNSYLSGCASALMGTPTDHYTVINTTLQAAVDIDFDVNYDPEYIPGPGAVFSNNTFLPYGQHPPRYIITRDRLLWDGTGPFPFDGSAPPPPPPETFTWTVIATSGNIVLEQEHGSIQGAMQQFRTRDTLTNQTSSQIQ